MKFISSCFFLLTCFVFAKAQTVVTVLPVDEQGKFIYYEVVEMKDKNKVELKQKAIDYFKKTQNGLKLKSMANDSVLIASGKLVINKTLLVVSHPSGEVLFHFHIGLKEGKYRFWLTDFSFIPYQRDRYGNFVAVTTIGTPLENDPGKLNASQWKEYQAQTAKYAKDLSDDFKQHMEGKMPMASTNPERKVVTKTW